MKFEVKITYEKTTIDGLVKKVTEAYLVNADSFADAEMKICYFLISDASFKSIRITNYAQLMIGEGNAYFDIHIGIITLDEKTGSERQSKVKLLVRAENMEDAKRLLKEAMIGSMMDYRVVSIKESKIVDTIGFDQENE